MYNAKDAIKRVRNNKAVGIHEILAEMLNQTAKVRFVNIYSLRKHYMENGRMATELVSTF